MAIQHARPHSKRYIDLSGPDGHAVALMNTAKRFARQLGLDGDAIVTEMRKNDYEGLIKVFDDNFGSVCDLYRPCEED